MDWLAFSPLLSNTVCLADVTLSVCLADVHLSPSHYVSLGLFFAELLKISSPVVVLVL